MLWNRFEQDREFLDLYENPHFDAATGIIDPDDAVNAVKRIDGRSHPIRKARACAYILRHCAIDVNPKGWFGANFAGRVPKYVNGANAAIEQLKFSQLMKLIQGQPAEAALGQLHESGAGVCWSDFAHWVPDWDAVLSLGFRGLLDRAREYRDARGALTESEKDYFDAIDIILTACIDFVDRLVHLAMMRNNEDERMPLRIKCLKHLRDGAPTDTYEALQMIYLFHLIGQFVECAQVRSLGDLDRLLYPYYLKDLYRGTYTPEQVKELLKYFFILYDFQNHHYNQPVSVAGTDIFGRTAVNPVTELIVDAVYEAKLTNIKIHIFVDDNTPDEFLAKTMDMIRNGRGSFVFMNTKLGIAAMEAAYNVPVQPHELGSQGCYNFNIKGRPQHANQGRISLPKAIELALFQGTDPLTGICLGADTPAVEEMTTFADFRAAFYAQLDELIRKTLIVCDFYDEQMANLNPTPLFSSTFEFSLKAARDCFTFGITSILMMGLGTVADCLTMIEKHVFNLHTCSLVRLRDALQNDWKDEEALRLTLYNDPEKYGNNLDTPDRYAREVSDYLIEHVTGRPNQRGGQFVCHFETIDRCFRSGKLTGATPDGRHAHAPYSKNLNAAFGQDRNGLTAMMLSAAKLDLVHMPIGAPIDFMLHPSAVRGEEGLSAMVELLHAFLRMGGYALQGNVLDADMLRDAQLHPELYKNLQVRVSGWNWPFVEMSREYQDTFIQQAEMNQ